MKTEEPLTEKETAAGCRLIVDQLNVVAKMFTTIGDALLDDGEMHDRYLAIRLEGIALITRAFDRLDEVAAAVLSAELSRAKEAEKAVRPAQVRRRGA
jgi:hypothetical protein